MVQISGVHVSTSFLRAPASDLLRDLLYRNPPKSQVRRPQGRGLRPVGIQGMRSVARACICEIGQETRAALGAPRLGQAVEIVAACFAQTGPIGPPPSPENLGHDPPTRQAPSQDYTHEAQHQEKRLNRTGEIGRHRVEFRTSKGRPHSGQRGFGSRRISYPQPAHRPKRSRFRRRRTSKSAREGNHEKTSGGSHRGMRADDTYHTHLD